MELGLRGRACIVTGASRGIGRASAAALCAEGAHVVLAARDHAALADAAKACSARGGRAEPVAVDVTAPDAAPHLVTACEERFGRLDVVVNNAGTSARRELAELADDDWREQWELNVMAPLRLLRAATPRMAERGWGRVVNVCSSAAKHPAPSNGAYSVAKTAELALSRVFADAYAASGVLVNAVAPGPVESPMRMAPGGLADQAAERAGVDRENALAATRAKIPLRRMGTAEEVAAVIVLLASERAGDVAGAAWSVDGGTAAAAG